MIKRLILLFLLWVFEGSLLISAEVDNLTGISKKIEENGARWKRNLEIVFGGIKHTFEEHHYVLRNSINECRDIIYDIGSKQPDKSLSALSKKNLALIKITLLNIKGDYKTIDLSIIDNIDQKDPIFLSGYFRESLLEAAYTPNIISIFSQYASKFRILEFNQTVKNKMIVQLIDLVSKNQYIVRGALGNAFEFGIINRYINSIINVKKEIKLCKWLSSRDAISKNFNKKIGLIDNFISELNKIKSVVLKYIECSGKVDLSNKYIKIVNSKLDKLSNYINWLRINIQLEQDPKRGWPRDDRQIFTAELRKFKNEVKGVLMLLEKWNEENKSTVHDESSDIESVTVEISSLQERAPNLFDKIENLIKKLFPDAIYKNNIPNIYQSVAGYLKKLEEELEEVQNKLIDSEQWIRFFLYENAENIYNYIVSELNKENKDFKDYSLMILHIGNYYDMCPRCTATWAVESVLGNNHDVFFNEEASKFSFFSRFNKVRFSNNIPMMRFLVMGSSITSTSEGIITRYEMHHDGAAEVPIDIPKFLPLIAFKMPQEIMLNGLPEYANGNSSKRLLPQYFPQTIN